jgi:polar amino acid transport system substrate-binding protein
MLFAAAFLFSGVEAQENVALKELAPSGKLRFGVVFAPAPTALFVTKDAGGEPHGVTVDLANELGGTAGVPAEFTTFSNTGLLTDAIESGAVDAGFMPVDEERKKRVDFGPAYFLIESTLLVTGASGLTTVAGADQPDVRIIGVANTTTIRAATRSFKNAKIVAAASIDEAMALLRNSKADAFALSRDALPAFVKQLPGSRIADGSFQKTSVAIAVPKNRPHALAYVSDFLERAKTSGLVRRVMDKEGFPDVPVAP